MTDAAPDASTAASLWASPVLPAFDAATVAHVQSVRAMGAQQGNRLSVFAKVGDSITAYTSFLVPIGNGDYTLGTYGVLSSSIGFFTSTPLYDSSDSFTRASFSAVPGSTTNDALNAPSTVQQELTAIHPAYAIMMFGTNDLGVMTVQTFTTNMNKLVDLIEANGTVVVVSTIPPRTDYPGAAALVTSFNDAIRQLVASRHLPFVDLYVGLAPLPAQGIGGDGVHPSIEYVNGVPETADFTSAGLRYGFDVRNLTTVQMFDRLRALP